MEQEQLRTGAGDRLDRAELRRRDIDAGEARRKLADVLGAIPAAVVVFDRDDRLVFANDLFRAELPAIAGELRVGNTLRDLLRATRAAGYVRLSGDAEIDALYDTDLEAWIDGAAATYRRPYASFERQHEDGRWFQVVNRRIDDGSFVGVRTDITDIKAREQALQVSQRENEVFNSLIDNLPVAIFAKRDDLKLTYVNKGWCELTGYTREEAIGRTDVEVFGPVDGVRFAEVDRAVLASGEALEIEEIVTRADGAIRHQRAQKGAFTASDGTRYLIGSTTDVTDHVMRERELVEARRRAVLADRAKSEFLANMSHEIRTPMNGVLGMAELLARSELTERQRVFTDIIVKSGNALLTIINDILDFSKIDAGQLVLDPVPFQLSEAVTDVATLLSTRAKEKDLELIVRIEPGLHDSYIGDVARLRQIVINLIGNAVKFTEAGYVLVDIGGQPQGDETVLRIAVSDTGIGIPADKLDLVFDKFSQVDASSTRRHEGTGLGLAISARLVALMEGEMGVESREGQGSTFWFTVALPRIGYVSSVPVMPFDVAGARILVVDDNPINRTILSEQMASWRFDACAAEGGEEALAVLDAAAGAGIDIDCCVLDYQMPGMNGVELARRIRAGAANAGTPIVLLTSVDQALSPQGARDLRIAAQLTKPAKSSVLLDSVVAAVRRRRGGVPEVVSPPFAHLPEPNRAKIANTIPALGMDGHRVDILVAEDNEVNQLVFTQILGETGYSFQIVGNGRLAVEAFQDMRPRMILMDVSMPELSGTEATAAIREIEARAGGRVAIVGVTAHALKGDRERCFESGMDDYLPKPISPRALVEKVERWMSGRAVGRAAG